MSILTEQAETLHVPAWYMGLYGTPPLTLIAVPRGFEAKVFRGRMAILAQRPQPTAFLLQEHLGSI